MKDSARYVKIVEWSDEDGCYVGSCPGLFLGGCHGNDERAVFDELCVIVEETIRLYHADGKPLTSGHGRARLGEPASGRRLIRWSNGQEARIAPVAGFPES